MDDITDCEIYENDTANIKCNDCSGTKVTTDTKLYCVEPLNNCDVHKDN